MSQGIFRQSALEKMASPEQLDYLMHVTTPRGWLALAALAAIVVAAVIWAAVGTMQVAVSAQGVILPAGGVRWVAAASGGVVETVTAAPGQRVGAGATLLMLRGAGGTAVAVSSPAAGQVLDVLVGRGQAVAPGASVVTLAPSGVPLEAEVFVPVAHAAGIRPGVPVQVSPAGVSSDAFGFMLGRVQSVTPYPVTRAGTLGLVGNDQLASRLLAAGPTLGVRVTLQRDAATPSGYAWSSGVGPPGPVAAGTLAGATVVLGQMHPISLLVPSAGG